MNKYDGITDLRGSKNHGFGFGRIETARIGSSPMEQRSELDPRPEIYPCMPNTTSFLLSRFPVFQVCISLTDSRGQHFSSMLGLGHKIFTS
jgi:hypothetical protein